MSTRRESTLRLVQHHPAMADQPVHPSMQRLLDAAHAATAASRSPVRTWADLLKRLNVTDQVFTNWKRRGLSKDGAIEAGAVFGVDAHFLLTGATTAATRHAAVHHVSEAEPAFLSDAALLARLGTLLATVPPDMRNPVADVLAGWARDGGQQPMERARAILALIGTSGKQRAAA